MSVDGDGHDEDTLSDLHEGVTGMADLPIMCTLGPGALTARKAGLLAGVARLSMQTVKIAGGYWFEFGPEAETPGVVSYMIDAERHCCRFLRFALTVEPDGGPIRLEITGPKGTQEFVEALLESG
jgi:hypothetical protein